jgi:hypothetical protein
VWGGSASSIFIIDENNAPIGVVGTIDVLRALMAHTQ